MQHWQPTHRSGSITAKRVDFDTSSLLLRQANDSQETLPETHLDAMVSEFRPAVKPGSRPMFSRSSNGWNASGASGDEGPDNAVIGRFR